MTRVLVVDDDELQLDLVERSLRYDGFEVGRASDASRIADAVKSFAPDVILLDVSVSQGDLAVPERGGAKLVLYSASDESELRALTRKYGADGWISKSKPVTELGRRLKDFCAPGARSRGDP